MRHLKKTILLAVLPAITANLSGQTLLLNWNFDEASSGTAVTTDHGSSPTVDGRFFSDATRTANTPAGFSLGALDVTASAESNVLANVNDLGGKLDSLTSFTISTWVNMQAAPAANQRIFRAGSGAGFGIRVAAPTSGTISASNFGLTLDLGAGGVAMNYDVDAGDSWLFLAFTYDAAALENNVNLYVGTESSAAFLAKSVSLTSTDTGVLDTHLRAGAHPGVANRGVPGYLDDLRIYSGMGDAGFVEDLRLANIPEPGTTALLFGIGAIGFAGFLRRKRNA